MQLQRETPRPLPLRGLLWAYVVQQKYRATAKLAAATNPILRQGLPLMPNVRKEVLSNGLTILTEPMTSVRSVSVGIWLRTGARQETVADNGISHFIEHMLFKGTTTRSAEDIARAADSIGGHLDAF